MGAKGISLPVRTARFSIWLYIAVTVVAASTQAIWATTGRMVATLPVLALFSLIFAISRIPAEDRQVWVVAAIVASLLIPFAFGL